MKQFNHVIKDELGIHARPAGMVVKLAAGFTSSFKITCGGKTAEGKSIIGVLGLGAKCGEELTLTFDGADEEAAADAMKNFLNENL